MDTSSGNSCISAETVELLSSFISYFLSLIVTNILSIFVVSVLGSLLIESSELLVEFRLGAGSDLWLFIKITVATTETTMAIRIGMDIISFLFSVDILGLHILSNKILVLLNGAMIYFDYYYTITIGLMSVVENNARARLLPWRSNEEGSGGEV